MLGGAAYAAFLKDTLFTVARDGPDKILRYFYSPGLYGYMDRQIDWDGAYSYRLKLAEMHRLAVQIENTAPSPTAVAVLWSTQSYDQDARMYSRWGALGTAYALMCAKVHYAMVTERDIREGALEGSRVLIVPEQRFLDDATLKAIRRFAAAGGTVFATGVPGMFDERGAYRGHPLADVFGADLEAFKPIQAVLESRLVPTRPDSIWGNRERGVSDGGRRGFHPNDWLLDGQLAASFTPREGAEAMARFADGSVAIVRARFGTGTGVICGYPFGHEYAFSNPTEMSFGKIYPHYSYPPQMTALEAWLGAFLREVLGAAREVQVPRSWMDRFVGRQRSGPSLTYVGFGDTYESKRLETDEPNHSLAIGLRERALPGGARCELLTVFNRDSAYATGRGYLHYMASPTHAIVRLERTDVAAVYDVLNGAYVPLVRGDLSRARRGAKPPDADKCVSFEILVPPYFGRVFAISAGPQAELFADDRPRRSGVSRGELAGRVERLAHPWTPPDLLVWDRGAVAKWLGEAAEAARAAGRPVVISAGSPAYRAAAETLAEALRARGAGVRISTLPVRLETHDPDPYNRFRSARHRRPLETIDVFLGNDYDNSNLADLTGAWRQTDHANPRLPVSVNRDFPGGGRAVLMLTRPFFVRDPGRRDKGAGEGYHVFREAPRQLVVGAGTPEAAAAAVRALLQMAE